MLNKVILVKNSSRTLSPILRTLENFQRNKDAYARDGYKPANDKQIADILTASDIEPTDYINPLKVKETPPPTPSKKKKEKEVSEDIEQIKEKEKED